MGVEVLEHLRRDHGGVEVHALARSDRSAGTLAGLGAVPLRGDLAEDGAWQRQLDGFDVVVHMSQPQAWGQKVTTAVAQRWEAQRLEQEKRLLSALAPGTRVVYTSGSSWYGHTGIEKKDETMTPSPCGWGPYLERPQDQAEQLASERELDLVIAFPAGVYGPGSWFAELNLTPLRHGKRLFTLMGSDPWMSPIHVEDCARALVHLARVGSDRLDAAGRRVLLVDDEPIPSRVLVELAAEALGAPIRTLPLPGFLVRAVAGEVVRSYLASQWCYSNARLKSLGFELKWATAREGVPDVVARWLASTDGTAA